MMMMVIMMMMMVMMMIMQNVCKVQLSFKNRLAAEFAALLAVAMLFSTVDRWVKGISILTKSEDKENQFCLFVGSL
jgi:uncharacterized integral membrane protein